MTYRQILDDAIGDAPASTVDVDGVISRQRRAWKLRRWGACGAGAAAVLAVTATVAQVLPGRTPTEPADGRRITTVAGTPADRARLDGAVFAALRREVPGLQRGDSGAPGIPGWSHAGGGENTLAGYFGQGGIAVDGAEGHLIVQIERHGARRAAEWNCAGPGATCRENPGPRGERVWTHVPAGAGTPEGDRPDRLARQSVEVLRPADDTLVVVSLIDLSAPNRTPAMTLDQQTAVALDPDLVLAPLPPGVVVTPPAPAPGVSSGLPSAGPTGTGTSAPPADPAHQRRIDDAVFASLRRQAPAVTGQGGAAGSPAELATVWTGTAEDNTADSYWGQGRIVVNGVAGHFSVQMHRRDPGLDGNMACGKPSKSYACAAGAGPGGQRYRTVTNTTRNGSGVSAERNVSVRRADGSWLMVSLSADPPEGKFALTAAQQQAVALDRAIALAAR